MPEGLTAQDLAYMRETQAAYRPTPAFLQTRSVTSDGMGGRTQGWNVPGEPVMVRLDGTPDRIPPEVAARVDAGGLVLITVDLIDLRAGDRIVPEDPATGTPSAIEGYEIVTDGDPDRWATAQQVYARRYLYPPAV